MITFFEAVRSYNQAHRDKVRVGGVDVQNTDRPTERLLSRAVIHAISRADQDALRAATQRRGRGALALSPAQRSAVDRLLARLSKPRSRTSNDVLDAVAARSLRIQYDYWTGDPDADAVRISRARDAGMAALAQFLLRLRGTGPAVLWAHDAHISRADVNLSTGRFLTDALGTARNGYYAVGFYVVEGSYRAWDTQGKIGVISHRLPPPRGATVEKVLSTLARSPDIAWVALHHVPTTTAAWLRQPHYVQEAGHTAVANTERLRIIADSFDAFVSIRVGHDSTPTATGTRTAQ